VLFAVLLPPWISRNKVQQKQNKCCFRWERNACHVLFINSPIVGYGIMGLLSGRATFLWTRLLAIPLCVFAENAGEFCGRGDAFAPIARRHIVTAAATSPNVEGKHASHRNRVSTNRRNRKPGNNRESSLHRKKTRHPYENRILISDATIKVKSWLWKIFSPNVHWILVKAFLK